MPLLEGNHGQQPVLGEQNARPVSALHHDGRKLPTGTFPPCGDEGFHQIHENRWAPPRMVALAGLEAAVPEADQLPLFGADVSVDAAKDTQLEAVEVAPLSTAL